MAGESWRQLPESPWVILGVEPSASVDEIRATHRVLALEAHPDRNPGDAAAVERMKLITWSFAVVNDPAESGAARAHFHPVAGDRGSSANLRRGWITHEVTLAYDSVTWGRPSTLAVPGIARVMLLSPELPTPYFEHETRAARGGVLLRVSVSAPTDSDREHFMRSADRLLASLVTHLDAVDGARSRDRLERLVANLEWVLARCADPSSFLDSEVRWRAAQLVTRARHAIS